MHAYMPVHLQSIVFSGRTLLINRGAELALQGMAGRIQKFREGSCLLEIV